MNTRILEPYRDLRVSDVCDAMDMVGLMNRGLMDPAVRPLYRDLDAFTHRISGPAMTIRYLPTQQEVPAMAPEAWQAYIDAWRRDLAPSFYKHITPGVVIVIDAAEMDVGLVGSGNALGWIGAGAAGVVTNGGARDTDELILQRCPVYSRFISRSFKPARLEFESVNRPINCGGVTIHPGDLIVADGDGVICVPRDKIDPVTRLAREEAFKDRAERRKQYAALGLPIDPTVA